MCLEQSSAEHQIIIRNILDSLILRVDCILAGLLNRRNESDYSCIREL